jgi:hypothetical protein
MRASKTSLVTEMCQRGDAHEFKLRLLGESGEKTSVVLYVNVTYLADFYLLQQFFFAIFCVV